ncbi:MAG: hypothetical protein IAC61_05585 [Firmicutes bacterium]|uniref:HNH endonuclease 5 domain-containing protein n=1 Tax=Candidatus Alloenteromonas pullistercoris TaxID=2840785 RepID=A0A9D9DHA8_9FIRM|nr:hypothetical protein [Candidatus Enteromonas pullistercoris]
MFDAKSKEYFDSNYDTVFDYEQRTVKGGCEIWDVTNGVSLGKHLFYFKDSSCTCRFCGKTKPEAKFKDKAHTYPEFMGNKLFVSKNNECDACNHAFGEGNEAHLRAMLSPYLVFNDIKGKRGQAKYKSSDESTTATTENGCMRVTEIEGSGNFSIDEKKKKFTYSMEIPSYSRHKVYKALLKMALASLGEADYADTKICQSLLKSDEPLGCEFFLFEQFPGFGFFNFQVSLFKRKQSSSQPTYQFIIRNQNFLFQIPFNSDTDIESLKGTGQHIEIAPVPTRFDRSVNGNAKVCLCYPNDMVEVEKHKRCLEFGFDSASMQECLTTDTTSKL